MILIDKDTYKLTNTNFYEETYEKTQIVIGHSGRKDMRHFESWVNRRNGTYKNTSAFTIDVDGKTYQHYDPIYYSDFLNLDQDKCNISITLVNQGWLILDEMNVYVDWLGHVYSKQTPLLEKKWRNYNFWVKYPEKQIESLISLLKDLCEKFNIKNHVIDNNVYNENVDIFKGITFRSNYSQDFTDVSPAFDIENLKKSI